MTPKEFKRFLDRDGGCLHCGEVEAAVPHHRANRGMGGSKSRAVPSNIIVMCAVFNGLMESDPAAADLARKYGWKVSTHETPANVPVWDCNSAQWFLLNDSYQRIAT